MKIKLLLLFLCAFSVKAQTYNGPESVEFDYANNRWLISNTTSHQVLARDSAGVLTIFKSGFTSGPYGIEIVGDTLFCCCGSTVKGYLLSNATEVFSLNIGASFLNGITHDDSGNLFVTDYTAKTIHRVNISTMTDSVVASALNPSPNGIIFDQYNNRCVFVNWGANAPVKSLDLATYAVAVITATALGSCDGIARDGNGRYYVSNWSGQSVAMFDSSFSAVPVPVVTGLHNPADIFYNVVTDTLGVPNAQSNTVTFHGFGIVGIEKTAVNKLNIYPNPASEYISISVADKNITDLRITDLEGRIQNCNIQKNENEIIVDIRSLAKGVYNLQFKNKSGVIQMGNFIKTENK